MTEEVTYNPDDYKTIEEKEAEKQLNHLQKLVDSGAMFESLAQHPAFKLWQQYIEGEITDSKNKWLTVEDRAEQDKLRYQIQGMIKAWNWVKGKIAEGKIAAQGIKQFKDDGDSINEIIQEQLKSRAEKAAEAEGK